MHNDDVSLIIQVLRSIREERYLTVKGLAQQLGFSAGHLSMIFSGKRRPGIRFVRAAIQRFPKIRHMVAKSLRSPGEPHSESRDDSPG